MMCEVLQPVMVAETRHLSQVRENTRRLLARPELTLANFRIQRIPAKLSTAIVRLANGPVVRAIHRSTCDTSEAGLLRSALPRCGGSFVYFSAAISEVMSALGANRG